MPNFAIFPQKLPKPVIVPPPRVGGKTRSPDRVRLRSTSQAAFDSGRIDRPVLVSGKIAVRLARSTSDHRSPSASPLRHPVSVRNRSRGDSRRPDVFSDGLPQRSTKSPVFLFADPSVALAVGKSINPAHWIVRPHAVPDSICENRPEHSHGTACCALPSTCGA